MYTVKSRLKHNGEVYEVGAKFEGEAPANLVEAGVLVDEGKAALMEREELELKKAELKQKEAELKAKEAELDEVPQPEVESELEGSESEVEEQPEIEEITDEAPVKRGRGKRNN